MKGSATSTDTLTSLAILKVQIDQDKDYLDYLRPFVQQILSKNPPEIIADSNVSSAIRDQFGLEIPARAVQIVLKRLARDLPIRLEHGVYRIVGELPNPGLDVKKVGALRHINTIVAGLSDFARQNGQTFASSEGPVGALLAFLSRFSISCIRSYLRGTVLPKVTDGPNTDIVLVSEYLLSIQNRDLPRFESFMVLVQGHMLANSLLCPDLQDAPRSYKGVTFFFDTRLVVRLLGLEGALEQNAVEHLVRLLGDLGGRVALFSHTRDELETVLSGSAEYVNKPGGRGSIVLEARRAGRTKSDILMLLQELDERLDELGLVVIRTPRYRSDFQIDETVFERVLDDEVSYLNPRAREYDVNSVRSVYALRENVRARSLEKCGAVLVTSNSAFARAAFEYGRKHEVSQEVSPVISDFSLANMAWLKAPLGAPDVPRVEVLAYSYAAVQPSAEFLEKVLTESDRLHKSGRISARQHQLMRSSVLAQDELAKLTLGDDRAIRAETILQSLERVEREIKLEESVRLTDEQQKHGATKQRLAEIERENAGIRRRIFWSSRSRARAMARSVTGLILGALLLATAAGLGIRPAWPVAGWLLFASSVIMSALAVANLMWGETALAIQDRFQKAFLGFLLRREAVKWGIDPAEWSDSSAE